MPTFSLDALKKSRWFESLVYGKNVLKYKQMVNRDMGFFGGYRKKEVKKGKDRQRLCK